MASIPTCVISPLACTGQGIGGGVVSGVANSGLQALADGAFTFLGKVLKLLTTFWINTPAPDLTSAQSAVALVRDRLQPLALFALTVGLLFASARLMWNARSGEPGAFSQALKGITQTVVVTGAGAMIVSVLLDAFDQWADHILSTGFDGKGVGEQMAALSSSAGPAGQLGPVFAILLYGLAGLSSLLQFGLMLIRAPVVVLMCSLWPVTAASAVTKEGAEAFRKTTSWLLSWILFKLTAAIVYATAFAMLGDSGNELGTVEGLILLVLAVLALPALIRLISPATQAISGSGGQLLSAAAGAGGQIAGASIYSRAGHAAQNHRVGSATPFSGSTGGNTGAAAGAVASSGPTGRSGTPSPAPAGAAGRPGTPGTGPGFSGGGASAGGTAATSGTAAAAGPVGAVAAGAAAIPAARTGAEQAAGAADTHGGS